MIQVRNLAKHFQVGQHREGLLGSLRNLASRQYKTVRAVDNISFDVQKGELVGYLGPNGAFRRRQH